MECFKGCNNDHPKMAYHHKAPTSAPVKPQCTIIPSQPLAPGDNAVQIEVPKHDAFSICIQGIGTFTNTSPYIKHPYSATPIPKIKRGVECAEYFQAAGGRLEVRCFGV